MNLSVSLFTSCAEHEKEGKEVSLFLYRAKVESTVFYQYCAENTVEDMLKKCQACKEATRLAMVEFAQKEANKKLPKFAPKFKWWYEGRGNSRGHQQYNQYNLGLYSGTYRTRYGLPQHSGSFLDCEICWKLKLEEYVILGQATARKDDAV